MIPGALDSSQDGAYLGKKNWFSSILCVATSLYFFKGRFCYTGTTKEIPYVLSSILQLFYFLTTKSMVKYPNSVCLYVCGGL